MTTIYDIFNFIDSFAPFESQMDFDNSGLLVGDFSKKVKKSLICLDITKDVINESLNIGADLIISHHPVIFHPIRCLHSNSVPYLLAKNEISAICAHTNLDLSPIGINYCLFEKLKLKNQSALSSCNGYDLGYCGTVEKEMSSKEFAQFVKLNLECKSIRFTNISKKINKVAVCSGAGGNLILDVKKQNCDAFVTGEIKHSDILFANDNGISIFDVGHFKSENIVVPHLKRILQEKFDMIEFAESNVCNDKIQFI